MLHNPWGLSLGGMDGKMSHQFIYARVPADQTTKKNMIY